MKKLLAISITVLFLYNTVGYLVVFKSFQYGIKKEIKTKIKGGLDNKDLVLIKIPSHPAKDQHSVINWKEENEFSYNGNMYDVVRQSVINDTIYYYCINDSREKNLFATLDQQVDQNMASSATANNLVKLFKLTVDQTYIFCNLFIPSALTSKAAVSIFSDPGYHPVKMEVETPPPRIV